jgi:hypothetical protein
MYLPMVPLSISGGAFESGQFWAAVATVGRVLSAAGSGLALWAQSKAAAKQSADPVAELTERLRRPVRHALRHPVEAARRAFRFGHRR